MSNVVYFLGAGFSAPLGLPLTTTFLEKSKEIYFGNPERYAHFGKVFETIKEMSVAKNYFETDLFNIEEILSILEMKTHLAEKKGEQSFLKYISDVIIASTPTLRLHSSSLPSNWESWIFGPPGQREYAAFFASLLKITFVQRSQSSNEVECTLLQDDVNYSIVTPNYDLIAESFSDFIRKCYSPSSGPTDFVFLRANATPAPGPHISKLHGSVDAGDLVPPTWNKALHERIIPDWKLAFTLLSEANHIRIIGYSLPEMDAYMRYLFKAAILESQNLKTFDVICLDPSGTIHKRYDDFVTFPKYRFRNINVLQYLVTLHTSLTAGRRITVGRENHLPMNRLEEAHESFMAPTSFL